MTSLCSKKPEQEQRLLSALVNKLGDPDRKLASKVGFLLSRLLTEHPMMKVVVVREVERFMFRPGLQDRCGGAVKGGVRLCLYGGKKGLGVVTAVGCTYAQDSLQDPGWVTTHMAWLLKRPLPSHHAGPDTMPLST